MDFAEEIGKELSLRVGTWKDPRGTDRIGFGAEAIGFDELLYKARTPEQKRRDEIRMERDQWDFVPSDRHRKMDPDYGSLRIYDIKGEPPEPLVVGDAWKAIVLSCSFNPDAELTRDGRRKIRYTVKLVRRVETSYRWCDLEKRMLTTETVCGSNRSEKVEEVDLRRARYRSGDQVIDVEQAIDGTGNPLEFYRVLRVQSISALRRDQQQALRGGFDQGRFERTYQLPPASEQLLSVLQGQRYRVG